MPELRVVVLVDLGDGNQAVTFASEDAALEWLAGDGAALDDHVHDVAPIVSRRSLIRQAQRRAEP